MRRATARRHSRMDHRQRSERHAIARAISSYHNSKDECSGYNSRGQQKPSRLVGMIRLRLRLHPLRMPPVRQPKSERTSLLLLHLHIRRLHVLHRRQFLQRTMRFLLLCETHLLALLVWLRLRSTAPRLCRAPIALRLWLPDSFAPFSSSSTIPVSAASTAAPSPVTAPSGPTNRRVPS